MSAKNRNGVLPASVSCFYTKDPLLPSFFNYILCMGHYFCEVPYDISRNRYDSFLMLYTKQGKGIVQVGEEEYTLSPGEVCIIDCYRPHRYRAEQAWEFQWIHFDGGTARSYFSYLTDTGVFHTFLDHRNTFEQAWQDLLQIVLERRGGQEPFISQQLTQLLTILIGADHENTRKRPTYIDDTLKYIDRHLSSDLTLEFLAQRAALSPFHFSRRFKDYVGRSPYRYILEARIHQAKYYLKSSEDTVKEIGYRCGFQSEHSFCTAFKNETGQTPSQFRQEK